jgi:soluble lytic murein transglycosylase-like protein
VCARNLSILGKGRICSGIAALGGVRYKARVKSLFWVGTLLLMAASAAQAKIVPRTGKDGVVTWVYVPDTPRRIGKLTASRRYRTLLAEAARKYQLPIALLTAVLETESAGNARAVSAAGAQGLMQLIPRTQARVGVSDPFDPRESIFGGARYLRDLADRFDENLVLVIAAYHAGERAVEAAGFTVPDFPSTRQYVVTVLRRYYRAQAASSRPKPRARGER